MHDYIVVGAGLFGCVFARQMADAGKSVLVIDRRRHLGGNCYTEDADGIMVHSYGPHIFHTNDERVWGYLNTFTTFNNFINRPIAVRGGDVYSLPFNMYTFNKLFGVTVPEDAIRILEEQTQPWRDIEPKNLEEQALKLVGPVVYDVLIKEYTEKQWGRDCRDLPPEIIKRLPLRFTYDNNYFNAKYQGIPDYVALFSNLLEGIGFSLNVDYLDDKCYIDKHAKKVLYTGAIDEYYGYKLGELEYRSVRFVHEPLRGTDNFQGNAVVNYVSRNADWTRIIEHKHFTGVDTKFTVITKEYPWTWRRGDEPFYPINDARNNKRYQRYAELAAMDPFVIFGGRLGSYKYMDMDATVAAALQLAEKELRRET